MKTPQAFTPPDYDVADVEAFQALARGDCPSHLQQRALRWVIEAAAGTYDLSYRPTSDRDTCFAEGRRFVGLQIVKMLKIDKQKLKKGDDNG
ncbi:hypothetical protein BSL82_09550 [Tardibacter chloracetimidivorans]|uniref:Uncharacterized protein n=1 Tax=Tardibacter chloracetimidivorans TaxID=1921510 RepID=A0A1L3ZV84_9SPHN|nr:hypothetical protein [Tardibacter chloracetimidivorans]API59525.1 hypothetical protein BSL82_09550 [Tardibacter chloracetimidivorans]